MLTTLPKPDNLLDRLALHIATLGPAGRLPVAPGTWGSLAATLLAPFVFLPLPFWARLLVLILIFPVGSLCAGRTEGIMGRKDPGCVVIDELWGQWITIFFLTSTDVLWLFPAFVLFRIFDIIKPWPVRSSETWLPGGFGVMIDDAMAALYALVVLTLLRFYF